MLAGGNLRVSPAARERIDVGYKMIDDADTEALPLKHALQRFGTHQPACRALVDAQLCRALDPSSGRPAPNARPPLDRLGSDAAASQPRCPTVDGWATFLRHCLEDMHPEPFGGTP